jgi:hypothetical protein
MSPRCRLGVAAVALLALAAPSRAASRRALLVGIATYRDPQLCLQGPKNDLPLMKQLLTESFGFQASEIRVLSDEQATRQGILDAMEETLIRGVGPGDSVFFYYSGHGTQTPDQNGDDDDGLDEMLVPYDFDKPNWKGGILDDEIGVLLGRIPTDDIVIIFDCCHSGTMTRHVSPFVQARYVPPPDWVLEEARRLAAGRAGRAGRDLARTTPLDRAAAKVAFLAAATAEQKAEEAPFPVGDKEVIHGALTFLLVKGLRGPAAAQGGGRVTCRDAFQYVSQQLKAEKFEQRPELEGDPARLDRPLFGPAPVGTAPSDEPRVIRVAQPRVSMNRGAYQGVTEGSLYGVYPPGTVSPDPGRRTGSFAVTALRDHEADGDLRQGRAAIGDRVFEETHAFANSPLGVRVEVTRETTEAPDARQAADVLLQRLRTPPFPIQVFDQPSPKADVTVYITALRREGRLSLRSEVVHRNGREEASFSAEGAQDLALQAVRVLERVELERRLIQLTNPNPGFRIRLWVNRQGSDVFRIGEKVTFHFETDRDGYLVLLNLGPQGDIDILFPNAWHRDGFVRRGQTYQIPSPEMKFDIEVTPPAGQELVKAIATLQPLDLSADKRGGVASRGIVGPQDERFRTFTFRSSLDARGSRGVEAELDAHGFVTDVLERNLRVRPVQGEPSSPSGGLSLQTFLSIPLSEWSESRLIMTTVRGGGN